MVVCRGCDRELLVNEVAYEIVVSKVEIDGIVRTSDPADTVVICESCFDNLMGEDFDSFFEEDFDTLFGRD